MLYPSYTRRTSARPMRCYCSLLRGLPAEQSVSLTSCQCSRGFVEEYWQELLGHPVRVELLESSVAGAEEQVPGAPVAGRGNGIIHWGGAACTNSGTRWQ